MSRVYVENKGIDLFRGDYTFVVKKDCKFAFDRNNDKKVVWAV